MEDNNLQYLNSTIPCGFLKYTCEKQPKITYINEQMLKMLRLPETKAGEISYFELCRENIFLMIPMEERQRFARYLDRVYKEGGPLAGEIAVLRFDGTKAYFFGWVVKAVNEDGTEEYQSACMDITESHKRKREKESKRYIKALTDVYDKIFEYDLSNNTVKCLHADKSSNFKPFENISMQMEEATEKWITETAFEDDRAALRSFFQDFYKNQLKETEEKPAQIQYRAISSNGRLQTYSGLFLKLDSSIALFCCRHVVEADEAIFLKNENESLKNMQELVMRFTEGLAAFEVKEGLVTPLYASNNVCQFFGYTNEEWMPMMKTHTPIEEFVSRCKVGLEDFMVLLDQGEAEFTYYDYDMQAKRRMKAICSTKSKEGPAPRYVMLYNVDEASGSMTATGEKNSHVHIRTFGYFDVFVNDKPIAFRNEKSKELFALLVDRRGGYVSSEEAISFLWEDESANSVTLARYRKVALRLKNLLEEYGIADIVESVNGKRRIVVDKVQCDLYDYLSGKEEYSQLFKGSYLSNYSWGENTLAELSGENMF